VVQEEGSRRFLNFFLYKSLEKSHVQKGAGTGDTYQKDNFRKRGGIGRKERGSKKDLLHIYLRDWFKDIGWLGGRDGK